MLKLNQPYEFLKNAEKGYFVQNGVVYGTNHQPVCTSETGLEERVRMQLDPLLCDAIKSAGLYVDPTKTTYEEVKKEPEKQEEIKPEETKEFKCVVCGKVFKNERGVEIHFRRLHRPPKRRR